MKITIVGTGYVGLVTGACLADTGNEVWCVDKNSEKIDNLNKGILPIYEPGLDIIVSRNTKDNRLFFTNDLAKAIANSEICFLTVDTPSNDTGAADLTNVVAVANALGEMLQTPILLVTKSTVPVGTTLKVKKIVQTGLQNRSLDPTSVSVASNPEFLKEGTAIQDFRYPDRVVVGTERSQDAQKLHELYSPFMRKQDCFLVMDIASSELCKYASNAMLATRISFMNEMSQLCEKVGADIAHIRTAMGWDPRIGTHFLYAGLGYGGSCLPKDVLALTHLGKEMETPLYLVEAADQTNGNQRERFLNRIVAHFGGKNNVKGKTVALWGISFKPETDDIRQAPAIFLIEKLLGLKAMVKAFDPVAIQNARKLFEDRVTFCNNNYACLEGADCLIIVTEWNEFRSPNFTKMKQLLTNPVIFDGRNLYSPEKMRELGFDYFSIGR